MTPRLSPTSRCAAGLTLLLVSGLSVSGQQTGVVVRKPGVPIANPPLKVTRVVPPKASCTDSSALHPGMEGAPRVPDLVFTRDELTCVRHADGTTEELTNKFPGSVVSPKGDEVAYWSESDHTLRSHSLSKGTDAILDSLPTVTGLAKLSWSAKGRTLVYIAKDKTAPGIHYINLDTGKRGVLERRQGRVEAVPDAEHFMIIMADGIQLVRLADGQAEQIVDVQYPNEALLSPSGTLLGVLVSVPTSSTVQSASDDDTPDCRGGSFALAVYKPRTNQRIDVPFPEGFDTVYDFEFSPDERTVAVTFAQTGCDYPGEAARVYVVSLPDAALTAISPQDRVSVQAHWTPDGKTLVYRDYTGSDVSLIAVDLQTKKLLRLTNPGQNGLDQFVSWR